MKPMNTMETGNARMLGTIRARARDEQGVALVMALMAMLLLTGLGVALVMVTSTETMITFNYRNAQEALYAADAIVERSLQDVLTVPQWNNILNGSVKSGFLDDSLAPTLPNGTTLDLTKATTNLQKETDALNLWGANTPIWAIYAYGPLSELLPTGTIDSPTYVVVWAGDDPSETDGDPRIDGNGVVTLHAEAYGPAGTRKVVEVTVSRTSSTEMERGYVGQRGQDEQNRRVRKAAVQTPGKTLTHMRMNLSTGGMAVQ